MKMDVKAHGDADSRHAELFRKYGRRPAAGTNIAIAFGALKDLKLNAAKLRIVAWQRKA